VLGAGDRWFLVQAVGPEQLAFYALATKFALAAPIALQPFGLWWYPRRIATYHGPDGPQRCAQAVGTGFAALVIAATIVSLAAPPFISAVMPASYAAAGQLVPLVVLCLALNEVCSLVNMGCYMRRHGGVVLAINAAGAAVAFAGYCLLIPAWGVPGAIAATLAGQGARAIAFPVVGQRLAPIAYPIGPAVLLASLSTFAVVFAPRTDLSLLGALWCAGSAVVLVATAVATGLVPKPALMTPVGRIRGVLRRQTAGRRSLRNS
jgi:O-antigen/teichoic acid export membrane protein